jgi:hypothetical protein
VVAADALVQLTRQVLMLVSRRTWAGALVEDEVAPAGEADLGAVAAGAGAVQVEGRGRVGDVFVVDDRKLPVACSR